MESSRYFLWVFFPLSLALVLLCGLAAARMNDEHGQVLVYVGTYTGENSKGIYAWRFNPVKGSFSSLGLVAEIDNPSFLEPHPSGRFLYSVSETSEYRGERAGAVAAFSVDTSTGQLTFLNKVSSGGPGPCYIALDASGRNVLVANYGGGSVAVFPIREDGSLSKASAFVQHAGSSVNRSRQEGPHAHSINLSPDNRYAIAADLGLDQLLLYRFDPVKGSLLPHDPPFVTVKPGAGPRHFAFHPSGRFAYVINEMQSSITVFRYQLEGEVLEELQTVSTLPSEFSGKNSTAEIRVHPAGRFLYGSNRGHDTIAVFKIDQGEGTLILMAHVPTQGKTPRNFNIDPSGAYLLAANQKSDKIVVFRIDATTGGLTPTGQVLEAGSPVCVKFIPPR